MSKNSKAASKPSKNSAALEKALTMILAAILVMGVFAFLALIAAIMLFVPK